MINSNYQNYTTNVNTHVNLKTKNSNEVSKQGLNSQDLKTSKQNLIQNSNSQNTTQNITSNSNTSKTSNLVTNKSGAIKEILGYGVDKDGYFTSDFNEKAGIPKDYKINAKGVENFVKNETKFGTFSTHYSLDFAKTLGNAHKLFSQLIPQTQNPSFSKEELQSFPYAYKIDKDFNITQTYTYDEFKKLDYFEAFLSFNTANFDQGLNYEIIDSDSIFRGGDINASVYKNYDKSVDKGGVLMAFLNNSLFFSPIKGFLEGETNINGKLMGFDDKIDLAQRNELKTFMQTNKILHPNELASSPFRNMISWAGEWIGYDFDLSGLYSFLHNTQEYGLSDELVTQARNFIQEYEKLVNSNLSLNEFKEKYLDFKQRHDEFVKEYEIAMGDKMFVKDMSKELEEEQRKSSTPIQAKSDNTKTYTRENITKDFFLNLIKKEKDKNVDILEFLQKLKKINSKIDIKA